MQGSPSSRRVTARVGDALGVTYYQISKQNRTDGTYIRNSPFVCIVVSSDGDMAV